MVSKERAAVFGSSQNIQAAATPGYKKYKLTGEQLEELFPHPACRKQASQC
jgi:hypothetical protein